MPGNPSKPERADTQPPDAELLADWKEGDAAAGRLLYRRHHRALFRFLRSKVDDGIDDVVQDTFLTVLARAETFRHESTFRSFLLGIGRYKVIHYLRRRARAEAAIDPARISVAAANPSVGGLLEAREEERLLLRALREIPLDAQITLELHYWEGMGVKEIAAVLDTAPGTIKSRLSRARAALRERIGQLATSPDAMRSTLDDVDRWARAVRDRLSPA